MILIGPWNHIIELARELNRRFREYTCNNPNVTISAGIGFFDSHEPVDTAVERAERALKSAKKLRNNISLWDETLSWDELDELREIQSQLGEWHKSEIINNIMLYRFNEFLADAQKEEGVKNGKNLENLESLLWRSRLCYTLYRNAGGKDEETKKANAKKLIEKLNPWFGKYGSKFKVALWQALYNQRDVEDL